jgi:hypothetical protein
MRRLVSPLTAALTCTVTLGLTGCGAGATPNLVRTQRSRLPGAGSPALATRLLASAAAALDRVRSFHIEAQWFYNDAVPRTLSGEFSLPGRFTLSIDSGGQKVNLVVINDAAYVRGNGLYWANAVSTPNTVRAISNRWVKLPATAVPGLSSLQALADPKTLGLCALESGIGRVTGGQRTELNGQRQALAVQIEGDQPGIPTGSVLLAASGPPLPISISQFGPAEAGATIDPACSQPQTSTSPVRNSMLFFSRYDVPAQISPPKGWIAAKALTATILASTPSPASTGSSRRVAQQRQMLGNWSATGTVIQSNWRPGQTLQRFWQIGQRCAAGVCRPDITRTTAYGPVSTWLAWSGNHWTADFVMTVSCTDGTANAEHADWTLYVHPATIDAVEHDRTTGSCPPSTSVIRWVAQPATPPASTSSTS